MLSSVASALASRFFRSAGVLGTVAHAPMPRLKAITHDLVHMGVLRDDRVMQSQGQRSLRQTRRPVLRPVGCEASLAYGSSARSGGTYIARASTENSRSRL